MPESNAPLQPLVGDKKSTEPAIQSVSPSRKLRFRLRVMPRSKGDWVIIGFLVASQIVAGFLLSRSNSLGEMALTATVANSLCQAALDFYQNKEGKSFLSAGIRIVGVIVVVAVYECAVKFHLNMADRF